MGEFPAAFSPSPARVHDRALSLLGFNPCWIRRPYVGGPYSISHFRICSYCRCIHPGDLIEQLRLGGRLEKSARPDKHILIAPNPIAGELVPIGSAPGAIFDPAHRPTNLRDRLRQSPREDLDFEPSIGERLAGHFERPALELAPAEINWPFYSEHTTARQWAEILAAAKGENQHGTSIPGAEAYD